ncbi:PapG carbohydrate binding domain-containing protein, partial [Pseudomonas aeruginosa]|uniref:PapG carbohydrate binding domain-containing protein n=1 Tax=Pseudomonas aeruginosa TaxID=287 RepID=UPI0031B726BC
MKKWFSAFLFLSLSGCNDALASQSTMFYSFNDNIYRPRLSVKVTDIVQFIVDINSASSTATLSYVACNGFTWTHGLYWSEYFAWLVVPKHGSYNGYNISLELQSRGGFS